MLFPMKATFGSLLLLLMLSACASSAGERGLMFFDTEGKSRTATFMKTVGSNGKIAGEVMIDGEYALDIIRMNDDLSIAVQGPKAIEKLLTVKPEWADVVHNLKPFQGADLGNDWFVARTGYTGEDGVEVILPGTEAVAFFKALQAAGVQPCGLGARDTLRMEAGMNLYGNDMDDNTSPLEAGMGWTVDLKDESRDFVGKAALLALKEKGVAVKQVGLLLDKGGILRAHMEVLTDKGKGETTSGVFSPSLKQSIAIARVPKDFDGDTAKVLMRGKEVDVRVLKLPFVRNGQKQFD